MLVVVVGLCVLVIILGWIYLVFCIVLLSWPARAVWVEIVDCPRSGAFDIVMAHEGRVG